MAKVTYEPRGRGFVARVQAGALELVADGADLVGAEGERPELSGSAELVRNVALSSLLTSYSTNELAYRRARSPEKRTSHKKAAQEQHDDLSAMADLVGRLGDESVEGWCSGCYDKSTHRQVKMRGPKPKYLCEECGTATVVCAVPRCTHHAIIGPDARVTLRYCAEHKHEIPGFEKLDSRLASLADYADFLEHDARNADRFTKVAGGMLGAAVVVAPVSFLAAPALGSLIGASAIGGGLTGAAATSHGLAMLGGGAVASGGLGMVGGTAVVTATGSALGGALGATTASAYTGDDDSFAITRVRTGSGTPVVFASGFLTEGRSGWRDWKRIIDTAYPYSPVYQVHWGAKELKDLGSLAASNGRKAAVRQVLAQGAKRGSRAHGVPGLGWVLAAHTLATNPWTLAKVRAGMTGVALAELIARTDEGPFVLMGHSLGARVMATAAEALGTRDGARRLESVHLFGAAVDSKGDWRNLANSVDGTVWNYWSANDKVLRRLYKVAEVGKSAAGQVGFNSKFPTIHDRNVTQSVDGHSDYLANVTLAV